MYLSPAGSTRDDASASSIVTSSDSSHADSEFDTVSVSSRESSSDIISSVDSDSSDEQPVPAMRLHKARTCTNVECSSWFALGTIRGIAEYAWQAAGRSANALCFSLLVNATPGTLRPLAAAASALAAGYCGYRLLKAKVGDETCAQKFAVAMGSAAIAAAGGGAAACGWASPGLALASAGAVTFVLSGVARKSARLSSPAAAPAMPLLFAMTTGASLTAMVFVPSLRMIDVGKLPRRSLSLLAEAATTEIFKGATERMLPRASREGMSFERKLKIALTGLLPYAVASVLFNGALGNLLRAQMQSDRFEDLLLPMLVGALGNVVKGAVNAALLRCSRNDPAGVQAAKCPGPPALPALINKTALRFVIAHARDILYLSLVEHGISELAAACTAYLLYAFFAQHRDLLFDMMQGDGWSDPQVVVRDSVSSS